MATLIHEFRGSCDRSRLCAGWQEGDGLTARGDAVTCPRCRARQAAPDACTSSSPRLRRRCADRSGHGGPHHAEVFGVCYAWADDGAPERAVPLAATR